MNSKLKDLIPLFAIILMLAGAIFLLVALNGGNKKEDDKVVNNNAKVEKEVETDKEKDKEEEKVVTSGTGEEKDIKQSDVTEIIKETPKQGSTMSTDDFIMALVDKNIAASPKNTQVKAEDNTKEDGKVEEVKTSTQTTTKTSTKSTTKTPTYKVLSSIKYNSYTVIATDNNKIMLQSSANKILNSLDAGKISSMKIMNGYLYTIDANQALKKYTVSNDKLVLLGSTNVGCIPKVIEANKEYVFILKPSGEIVAIRDVNNTFSQAGFVREKDGIANMTLSYGSTITATDTSGRTYSYIFDGINFKRNEK